MLVRYALPISLCKVVEARKNSKKNEKNRFSRKPCIGSKICLVAFVRPSTLYNLVKRSTKNLEPFRSYWQKIEMMKKNRFSRKPCVRSKFLPITFVRPSTLYDHAKFEDHRSQIAGREIFPAKTYHLRKKNPAKTVRPIATGPIQFDARYVCLQIKKNSDEKSLAVTELLAKDRKTDISETDISISIFLGGFV